MQLYSPHTTWALYQTWFLSNPCISQGTHHRSW